MARHLRFAALAAAVALCARSQGAYPVQVWAPTGLVLVSAAWLSFVGGLRPTRLAVAASGCLVALGGWELASVLWGGLPQEAWTGFDRAILLAGAVLCGSCGGIAVVGAVLVGTSALAAEIVIRTALDIAPGDWWYGRLLEGPVGYHNAQAALFACVLPFAVRELVAQARSRRALAGAASVLLVGALLLTQSRGGAAVAAAAVLLQLLITRDAALFVRLVPLVAATSAVVIALQRVDAARLGRAAEEPASALGRYGLTIAGGSLGVAAIAAAAPLVFAPRARRALLLLTAASVAAIALAWTHDGKAERAVAAVAGMATDAPPATPAGSTRLASLSLNGRRDAWRVAGKMVSEEPVAGAGAGRFADRWATDRRSPELYILQPHSFELELASELGAIGLALFGGFVACLVLVVARTRPRARAAAAGAALFALVLQASVDWTWTFSGIVAIVLLAVLGVASSRNPARRPPWRQALAGAVAAAALAGALAVPWLAHADASRAARLSASNPAAAWTAAKSAHRLTPWDPAILSLQGRLAESEGRFARAASLYDAAARRSQRPWLEYFRTARALRRGGQPRAAAAACARAVSANPDEPRLRRGPCATFHRGNE